MPYTSATPAEPTKRLNADSVMERLDFTSKETLRQLVKRGALPPPVRDHGGGCNYWFESDIEDYLRSLHRKRAEKTGVEVKQPTAALGTMPPLAPRERWAGIVSIGEQPHHVILLPGDSGWLTWGHAIRWAKARGGDLPTRLEGALLFVNLKHEFKKDWYWTSEPLAGNPDYVWIQSFSNGYQDGLHQGNGFRARAVRRLPTQ